MVPGLLVQSLHYHMLKVRSTCQIDHKLTIFVAYKITHLSRFIVKKRS